MGVQAFSRRIWSDGRAVLDRFRVVPDELDQQRCLRVRPRTALLPVFQRAHVGPEISREDRPRRIYASCVYRSIESSTATHAAHPRASPHRVTTPSPGAQGGNGDASIVPDVSAATFRATARPDRNRFTSDAPVCRGCRLPLARANRLSSAHP